jgi:hypothetical protein
MDAVEGLVLAVIEIDVVDVDRIGPGTRTSARRLGGSGGSGRFLGGNGVGFVHNGWVHSIGLLVTISSGYAGEYAA